MAWQRKFWHCEWKGKALKNSVIPGATQLEPLALGFHRHSHRRIAWW